jgi:hypothetical protein
MEMAGMMKIFRRVGAAVGIVALGATGLVSTQATAAPGESAIQNDDPTTQLGSDADAYSVSAADLAVGAGAEGMLVVTIKAKGDHKVNEEYPHKVKLDDPPAGIELPKSKLTKDEGSFSDKKTFTFKIPVKGKTAGSHTVTGMVKFSVCNESQCVIKKETIKAVVTVK